MGVVYTITAIEPVTLRVNDASQIEVHVAGIIRETSGTSSFVPIQVTFTSTASITYNHNLGRKVDVTIFDSVGKVMTADVDCSNPNQTIINFVSPRSGSLLIV